MTVRVGEPDYSTVAARLAERLPDVASLRERLDAADVPCAPILRRGEIIDNEQVVARDIIAEFDQPMVGRVRQPKPAARFEVNEAAIGGPAPRVGEHSHEVLRELGYDDDAIDKMIGAHAIRMAV